MDNKKTSKMLNNIKFEKKSKTLNNTTPLNTGYQITKGKNIHNDYYNPPKINKSEEPEDN